MFISSFKKAIYLLLLLLVVACQGTASQEKASNTAAAVAPLIYQSISGKTMGTTYNITYGYKSKIDFQAEIDSILLVIDQEISTYNDSSLITSFNQSKESIQLQNTKMYKKMNVHFKQVFFKAKNVYEKTDGYFDPTVLPLVDYWGFGSHRDRSKTIDQNKIKELMQYVGFEQVESVFLEKKRSLDLVKEKPQIQLDFSAIGKGYGVDVLADFLERKGAINYLIEIGGETRAKGKNNKNKLWQIGINTPEENAATNDIYKVIKLQDNAIATSGNYRNFYEVNGVKYGHTINPKTGQTGLNEQNTLLSATVIARDCMIADAYATAFMAMGIDKAIVLAESLEEVEAYFIYSTDTGAMATKQTSGAAFYLVQ